MAKINYNPSHLNNTQNTNPTNMPPETNAAEIEEAVVVDSFPTTQEIIPRSLVDISPVPLTTNEDYSFDLPRLATELNTVLHEQYVVLEDKIDELKNYTFDQINDKAEKTAKDIDYIATSTIGLVEKTVVEKGIKFNEDIEATTTAVLSNIKDLLIAEINKGRSILTIVNNDSNIIVSVDFLDHPKTEDVLSSLAITKKAMLVGPAGTGKTFMISEIARKMNLNFYKYSCSRDSSVHDLLGYKQPASETYLDTVFLHCYENGGIFLVDEYDAMSGDMALFFNGVCDNSKFISVPHRDSKPQAVKHKNFYIVMCGNTWGKGSHEFSGRDFQDQALLDRFRLSKHFINYHIKLEEKLCSEARINYTHITRLRKELESVSSYLSTRNVEDICNITKQGQYIKKTIEMLIEDLTSNQKTKILSSMNFPDNNSAS